MSGLLRFYDEGRRNRLLVKADMATMRPAVKLGDWNDYVIIARGNVIKHFLNGYQTVEDVDNDPKDSLKSGLLALQLHQGPPMKIEFRDIRLKHFDPAP